MTRFMVATGLCVAVTWMGCSQKPYVSKYPETAQGDCSFISAVWDCNQQRGSDRQAVEAQQAQVGAERGTSDVVRVTPPPPTEASLGYECTNGEHFTVYPGEGGVFVKKGDVKLWLPETSSAQFSGDVGSLTIDSRSLASLDIPGEPQMRSCARDDTYVSFVGGDYGTL